MWGYLFPVLQNKVQSYFVLGCYYNIQGKDIHFLKLKYQLCAFSFHSYTTLLLPLKHTIVPQQLEISVFLQVERAMEFLTRTEY